eukprot:m.160689 g.160689  ORF g.160689 m.160689 type:complete len:555 (-) comp18035_c0_seq1:191-1855(-)
MLFRISAVSLSHVLIGFMICINLNVKGQNNGTTVDIPNDITNNLIGAELYSDFIGISSSYADYLKIFGNQTSDFGTQHWAIPLLNTLRTCEVCRGPRIRINGDQGGAKPWWGPQYDAWLKSINADNVPSFGSGPNMRIGPGNIRAIHAVAETLNGTVTSGLDWSVLVPRFPPAQYLNSTLQTGILKGIAASVGFARFKEFEIANEPDLNSVRSSSWNPAPASDVFVQQWTSFAQDLYNCGAPPLSIQGGVMCCVGITQNETQIIDATRKHINVWNRHVYPLVTNKNHTNVQVKDLLDIKARDLRRFVYKGTVMNVIQHARDQHLKFIIGESQGVNMGGAWNVSDVFAAALWTMDWAGNVAENGVSQLNLNFGASAYDVPYSYFGCASGEHLNCTGLLVRPQFYGIWAFNTAIQSDSGAPAQVINATAYPTGGNTSTRTDDLVSIRTFHRGDGNLACVAVNMHMSNETSVVTTVTLNVPLTYTRAFGYSLETRPSSPVAKRNVVFAGRTFEPGNNSGFPSGEISTNKIESQEVNGRRQFTFDVSPTSAIVVIVKR